MAGITANDVTANGALYYDTQSGGVAQTQSPTYWVGQDGNIYYGSGQYGAPVQNLGSSSGGQYSIGDGGLYDNFSDSGAPKLTYSATQISDPSGGGQVQGTSTTRSGGGANDGVAQQNAQYQSQVDRINSLLGLYAPQRETGTQQIDSSYNEQARRLKEQQDRANVGYQDQENTALQGRTRGYEQVDNYAKNSADSLSRIFQGANAGNSSVARQLAPSLVGKASDSRRLDVTETANQNLGGIKKAREDAQADFGYASQDLENNRGYAKDNLEKGITQQEADQLSQRLSFEQLLGRDTSGTQNEINSRTERLKQLFGAGSFNPSYQARAVAPKAVALNDYKVDPITLQGGQNPQAGGSYYSQFLKKKDDKLSVR